MARGVNTKSLRAAHVAETERRIIAAATRLFLAKGYAGTSLAAVADEAGVGARTVYVRFDTKANLFKRVVDVAAAGDTAPVAVLDRDWAGPALTAPTAGERITAWAAVSRQIVERVGGLVVAAQRAAEDPAIAAEIAQWREQTRTAQRRFWTAMHADGLLPAGVDLAWLTDTSAVLAGPDAYVLVAQMYGWDLDAYQAWVETTLRALVTPAT